MIANQRPALVLLGSLASTEQMWQLQTYEWSQEFQLVPWNYDGHGNSRVAHAMGSAASIAARLLADLDALGLEQFHVVGVSLGGMVALQLAQLAPQRVLRVVASHCRYFQTSETAAAWDERIALVRRGGVLALETPTLERWLSPACRAAHPERVALVQEMLGRVTADSYVHCATAVRDFDARSWVQNIHHRVLVVAGEADSAAPPEHVQLLASALPNGRYVGMAQGYHVPTLDAPETYAEMIGSFLRS